jgi:cyclophilin family peptidyl-prolyl cis-trans isomerase
VATPKIVNETHHPSHVFGVQWCVGSKRFLVSTRTSATEREDKLAWLTSSQGTAEVAWSVASSSSVRKTAFLVGSLFVVASAAVGIGAYATRDETVRVAVDGVSPIPPLSSDGPLSTELTTDPVTTGLPTTEVPGIGAVDTITGETIAVTTTFAAPVTSASVTTLARGVATTALAADSTTVPVTTAPSGVTTTLPLSGGAIPGPLGCPNIDGTSDRVSAFTSAPIDCLDPKATYVAEIKTAQGVVRIDLDQKAAPRAVNVFVYLARYKFYDGLTFHRVIPNFIIQGGDPLGNGRGGPGFTFDDELPSTRGYPVGSVAMANLGPNANGSQFFIVSGELGLQLPPSYTLFGQVSKGRDVLSAIEGLGTPAANGIEAPPKQTIVIQHIAIKALNERPSRVPGLNITTTTVAK